MLRKAAVTTTIGLTTVLVLAACGSDDGASSGSTEIPQPVQAQLAAAGLDTLPVAPESERVDLSMPALSNPTEVTNPLFPISELHSAILSGEVDGKPFHTETTLLPETRIIEWKDGQRVEVQVSQYLAYLDGRIEEAAIDYYAQADDGSVWYFGEEVFDYGEDGLVDGTLGSWEAGKDGPPAMIMPGDPQIGDVHRAENIPAIAFEEVEITTIDKTVDGPLGPVEGAIVARELHDDGTYSDKVFAPGYGEFYSAHEGDIEAMALAVPTDAVEGGLPPELEALQTGSEQVLNALQDGDLQAAASAAEGVNTAWATYTQGGVIPPRLATEMERALAAQSAAIRERDQVLAVTSAIDVAQSILDFELRYLPVTEIDIGRFELWARQVVVDAADRNLGGVRGDVATLEWIRDRFASTLDVGERTSIDALLVELRDSVSGGNEELKLAAEAAEGLREETAGLRG